MIMSNYGYHAKLRGVEFEEAVTRVTEELKKEGFGVLTEIDVKATLKKKLDVDFRRYTILGACNPTLAHRALSQDADIGLLLPCNVVVQEADGGAEVAIVKPSAMFQVVEGDALQPVAEEAAERLERVIAALG
jgi:uncharacterized protein (DUF302 family)